MLKRISIVMLLLLWVSVFLQTPPSAHAATIIVDGTTCTLANAIISANTNTATGGCTAGSGADTITLNANVNLTAPFAGSSSIVGSQAGLPDVSSPITIQAGTGNTISGNSTNFRIFNVVNSTGNLTLNGITVTGGRAAPASGGQGRGGAIYLNSSASLTLNSAVITNNSTFASDDASILPSALGGAIYAHISTTVVISSSTISNNTLGAGVLIGSGGGSASGGAIYSNNSLTITSSTISGNVVNGGDTVANGGGSATGGAISASGTVTISNSTISGNSANGGDGPSGAGIATGGAISSSATMSISNSTISGNFANGGANSGGTGGTANGGAISAGGTLTLTNSTISGNSALGGSGTGNGGGANGGGINFSGGTSHTIRASTIANNLARTGSGSSGILPGGGGIRVPSGAATSLLSSILGDNNTALGVASPVANDCAILGGVITSQGFNLVEAPGSGGTGCTTSFVGTADLLGQDASLQALANNGGGTLTHALGISSLAIDTGSCNGGAITTDQRGVARPNDIAGIANAVDGCDKGSYEAPAGTPTITPTFTPSNTPTNTHTHTPTNTATNIPTDTATLTPSDTATNIPTDTATDTPSDTPTVTDTPITPIDTATDTPPATLTHTPTHTATFTASNTSIPTCEVLAEPPSLVSPSHRSHTTDTTPLFTWGADVNAKSYRFMIYLEDRSFEFKKRLFTTTYTLETPVAQNKYLWRVRTQDEGCDTWTTWSKRNTLFID